MHFVAIRLLKKAYAKYFSLFHRIGQENSNIAPDSEWLKVAVFLFCRR